MRATILVVLLAVLACSAASSAQQEEKKTCTPGARFLDDEQCNWCTCGNDGVTVSCTKMACVNQPPWLRRKRQAEQKCTPGSRFLDSDGCNWCTCNSEGTMAACTRKFCVDRSLRRQAQAAQRTKRQAEKSCTPGVNYLDADGCNWCTCNDDGTPGGCTEKACVAFKPIVRNEREVPQRCTPGESFKHQDGCNSCICNHDGTNAACTLMACVKGPFPVSRPARDVAEKAKVCEPGARFLDADGCNWCTCNSDGSMAACTKKFCIDRSKIEGATAGRVKREEQKRCTPGVNFLDDDGCNWCSCNEDGTPGGCTEKACFDFMPIVRKEREVAETCTPGERFKHADNCNWCTCNDDGTPGGCTLMACISRPLPRATRDVSALPKVCEPGSNFMDADNCNRCICNGEGTAAFCTLKQCVKRVPRDVSEQKEKPKICTPNTYTRANDDCNTCKCSADGTAQECTSVHCPVMGGYVDGACTPNSVFRVKCNMCKCSDDGTRSFCTKRKCKRDVDGAAAAAPAAGDAEDKEVVAQTVCNPDEVKIEGCNRCKCAKNGIVWLCTPGSACAPNGNKH